MTTETGYTNVSFPVKRGYARKHRQPNTLTNLTVRQLSYFDKRLERFDPDVLKHLAQKIYATHILTSDEMSELDDLTDTVVRLLNAIE